MLYGESDCALARLELQEGPEKPRRGEAARRVIRLSDCLRVAEAGGEASSPRDTSAFFLETKERQYQLAAPASERSDWIQAICLLAFPVSHPWVPKMQGGMACVLGGSLGTCCGQMLEEPRSGCWGWFLVGVGDPSPECGKGQQAEYALEEGLGWRWGWAWGQQ